MLHSEAQRGLRGPGVDTPMVGRVFPYGAQHPFGISNIDGAVVTVAAGQLDAGTTEIVSAETDITITADGQFIGLEYDRSAGTLTVTGPHSSKPESSSDVIRTWLYVFDGDSTRCEMVRHNLTGIRLIAAL